MQDRLGWCGPPLHAADQLARYIPTPMPLLVSPPYKPFHSTDSSPQMNRLPSAVLRSNRASQAATPTYRTAALCPLSLQRRAPPAMRPWRSSCASSRWCCSGWRQRLPCSRLTPRRGSPGPAPSSLSSLASEYTGPGDRGQARLAPRLTHPPLGTSHRPREAVTVARPLCRALLLHILQPCSRPRAVGAG